MASQINTQAMNAKCLEVAKEIHSRFGGAPKSCGRMAKFIVMASKVLAEQQKALAAKGQELSPKGIDFVLESCLKHLDS